MILNTFCGTVLDTLHVAYSSATKVSLVRLLVPAYTVRKRISGNRRGMKNPQMT